MALFERKKKILAFVCSLLLCIGIGGTFHFLKDVEEVKNVVVDRMVSKAWKVCKSENGGFVVHFPTSPKVEERILPMPSGEPELSYSEYTSQPKEDVSYSVAFIELPKKWTVFGKRLILNESLKVIVKHTPGMRLESQEFKKLEDGLQVLDFEGKLGESHIEGRLILVGSTLFKLSAMHPYDEINDTHIQQFMESFNLAWGKN